MNLIKKELAYLRELIPNQRRLLMAGFLFALAQPMITIFSNTYLWRQSHNAVVLAIFGIGQYVGLCLGFLVNGYFLRRYKPTQLFFIGCLLQGAVPVLLVYMAARADDLALPLGLALGFASGFYWGNRNLLTSALTAGENRFKYISLESTFGLAASVSAPILTGWFLVLGERLGLYTAQSAYEVTALLGFILLGLAGWHVLGINQKFEKFQKLFIQHRSHRWQQMRSLDFVNGFTDGFERLIPLLILLFFLGNEESVGMVQSAAAVLSMLGLYFAGKRVKHKDHTRIVGLWTIITGLGKAIFAVLYSSIGALIFHGLNGLVVSFRWASLAAVMYEAVDREPGDGLAKRYRYLMDREFALNTGRILGLISFAVMFTFSAMFTIRYGLMVSIFLQIMMIVMVKGVTRLVPDGDIIPVQIL